MKRTPEPSVATAPEKRPIPGSLPVTVPGLIVFLSSLRLAQTLPADPLGRGAGLRHVKNAFERMV